MELNPVGRGCATDVEQLVLFEMEEDAVADDMSVRRARRELLRAIDRELREAVGREVREELQGVGPFDQLLGHVVRLVEQDTGVAPRALLVTPVRVFGRHYRIHVGADLRIAEQVDGIAGRAQQIFQALMAHDAQ